MLQQQDESSAEVNWEDQSMINHFAQLNIRMHEIENELEEKKSEDESLDDAINDLYMLEDEIIRIKLGESFYNLPRSEAIERLEESQQRLQGAVAALQEELQSVKEKMAEYKVKLYGKFGNSINLDE